MHSHHFSTQGNSTSFSEKERKDFQTGCWQVDCPHIELRRREVEDCVFVGPGTLLQDSNYQLKLRFFVTQSQGDLPEQFELEAGDLVPEDHYFDLKALDVEGRVWQLERTDLLAAHHHAANGLILEVSASHLWCESEIPAGVISQEKFPSYNLNLTIFREVRFPRNISSEWNETVGEQRRRFNNSLDTWQFEAAGCDLELRRHEGWTELRIKSPFIQWPDEFEQRVLESLFFCLGEPLYPAIGLYGMGRIQRRTVYSRRQTIPFARHKPPIHLAPNSDWGEGEKMRTPYRNLVDAYLRFALIHDRPRIIWAQLNAVYEASGGTFTDSWGLTLSVAIESLVNAEFADTGKPTPEQIQRVKNAQSYLDAHPLWDKEWKNRLKGSLGGLKSPRIGDRLKVLALGGAIAPSSPKKWAAIRNGTAHSYQAGSLEDDAFREHLATVEVLFYHVFFAAIGYKGPFTDYSTRGFPLRDYPFPPRPHNST